MGLDDSLHDRKPEPSATRTCRIEWVRGASQDLLVHAVTLIDNVDPHELSVATRRLTDNDLHRAPVGHGLKGVRHQIVEHQPQQICVGFYAFKMRLIGDRYLKAVLV